MTSKYLSREEIAQARSSTFTAASSATSGETRHSGAVNVERAADQYTHSARSLPNWASRRPRSAITYVVQGSPSVAGSSRHRAPTQILRSWQIQKPGQERLTTTVRAVSARAGLGWRLGRDACRVDALFDRLRAH